MRILKIRQLLVLTIIQFLFFMSGQAQYKSYQLNAEGDTLNAIDKNDKKQGKWVIHVESIRGEPGYEEEGIFKNNNKMAENVNLSSSGLSEHNSLEIFSGSMGFTLSGKYTEVARW